MNDTLYIQMDKNVKIASPCVTLGEIAGLYCANKEILNLCQKLQVYQVPEGKYGKYVLNGVNLIECVQKQMNGLQISYLGEPVFLLTYEQEERKNSIWKWAKAIFVCVILFFGAGFSIMTFNLDVDITKLFENLYQQVTGMPSNGQSEMELMYSLGVGAGVVFFFNHFGRKNRKEEPTPIEVQMRTYEDEADLTVMEKLSRSSKGQ